MFSRMPLILCLRTKVWDPYAYVVFLVPETRRSEPARTSGSRSSPALPFRICSTHTQKRPRNGITRVASGLWSIYLFGIIQIWYTLRVPSMYKFCLLWGLRYRNRTCFGPLEALADGSHPVSIRTSIRVFHVCRDIYRPTEISLSTYAYGCNYPQSLISDQTSRTECHAFLDPFGSVY